MNGLLKQADLENNKLQDKIKDLETENTKLKLQIDWTAVKQLDELEQEVFDLRADNRRLLEQNQRLVMEMADKNNKDATGRDESVSSDTDNATLGTKTQQLKAAATGATNDDASDATGRDYNDDDNVSGDTDNDTVATPTIEQARERFFELARQYPKSNAMELGRMLHDEGFRNSKGNKIGKSTIHRWMKKVRLSI